MQRAKQAKKMAEGWTKTTEEGSADGRGMKMGKKAGISIAMIGKEIESIEVTRIGVTGIH